jgi:hypothetical protein
VSWPHPPAGIKSCAPDNIMTERTKTWYAAAMPSLRRLFSRHSCCLTLLALCVWAPAASRADAGPPYLTNDPGTPGNGNWEINLAAMPTVARGGASYQLPQIDVNFGLGERLQLSYEIPYVLETRDGAPTTSGWSNAYTGVKWRFFDQREGGWQLSTFPQYETAGSPSAQRSGLAAPGGRWLLPLEVAKSLGPLTLNFETGYYLQGMPERIVGLVAGSAFTPRLELDAELYNDHVLGSSPDVTTLDVGGRFKLSPAFIVLFMAGRSIGGNGAGQVQFMGYFGVQILLGNYGRTLAQ